MQVMKLKAKKLKMLTRTRATLFRSSEKQGGSESLFPPNVESPWLNLQYPPVTRGPQRPGSSSMSTSPRCETCRGGTEALRPYGFLWIPIDSYGFLWFLGESPIFLWLKFSTWRLARSTWQDFSEVGRAWWSWWQFLVIHGVPVVKPWPTTGVVKCPIYTATIMAIMATIHFVNGVISTYKSGIGKCPMTWVYWTSPYSSHKKDHIPIMESNGWVMWKMGTWLMTHVRKDERTCKTAVFSWTWEKTLQ